MTVIRGVGAVPPAGAGPRRAGAAPGAFRMLAEARGRGAGAVAEPAEVGLAGMLALQEVQGEAVGDRAAQRRGQDLLAELVALQRALLGEDPADLPLARLVLLAAEVPEAADPALRAAVAAIVLRARIELARREIRS